MESVLSLLVFPLSSATLRFNLSILFYDFWDQLFLASPCFLVYSSFTSLWFRFPLSTTEASLLKLIYYFHLRYWLCGQNAFIYFRKNVPRNTLDLEKTNHEVKTMKEKGTNKRQSPILRWGWKNARNEKDGGGVSGSRGHTGAGQLHRLWSADSFIRILDLWRSYAVPGLR